MQSKTEVTAKHLQSRKDKFKEFWNYKNKKLTIAFIINWTIIALITVIFIIIVSLDIALYFKKSFAWDYWEKEENWVLDIPDLPEWVQNSIFPNYIMLESVWPRIVLSLGIVLGLYLIVSNITLFSVKYYLSKKHNKNK